MSSSFRFGMGLEGEICWGPSPCLKEVFQPCFMADSKEVFQPCFMADSKEVFQPCFMADFKEQMFLCFSFFKCL